MVIFHGCYRTKPGTREQLIAELKKADLENLFRAQRGNLFYTMSASLSEEDVVIFCDGWDSQETFEEHVNSSECKIWEEIRDRYIIDTVPHQYSF